MFARAVSDGAEMQKCLEIRRTVFIEEQGVTEELELDGLEDECIHLIAWAAKPHDHESAVGTARLRIGEDGVAKAQRVAVLSVARRTGVGGVLMKAAEDEARKQGATSMELGAQLTALRFYEAVGYEAFGDDFDDAGIPHRMMRRPL